jgi:hypothetical protein
VTKVNNEMNKKKIVMDKNITNANVEHGEPRKPILVNT